MQFWSNMKQVESWQIASLSFLDAPLNCKIFFKAQRNLSFTVQPASSCAVANSWVEKVRPGRKTTRLSLNMCSRSLAFKALSLLSRRSWPGLNESNVKVILIVFSHLSFKKREREKLHSAKHRISASSGTKGGRGSYRGSIVQKGTAKARKREESHYWRGRHA